MADRPLRLMFYDATCRGRWLPGLSTIWRVGAWLYRVLGRIDAWRGVRSWGEALAWLAEARPGRGIGEIQYWGHGQWGQVKIAQEVLDAAAFAPGHPLHAGLDAVRARLVPGGGALVWLRTCEAFGTPRGHAFAKALADFFGCRVAGHTYVIAAYQSGLHTLRPGEEPTWPTTEGLPEGRPNAAVALSSRRRAPNTITFLRGSIPEGY